MHPAEIKMALQIKGYSQAAVADTCGVGRSAVGMVVNGRGRSKQVEEWISTVTGRTLLELWPQWYGEGELTLTREERELVERYRELSFEARYQLMAFVQGGAQSLPAPRHAVHADRGSIASGGDVTIETKGARRGK